MSAGASPRHGSTLWLTGLSGAGKSTRPEIVVDTERNTPEESTAAVVRRLEELGVL